MAERECECSERNKMTRRRKGYKERMVLRGDEGVRNYLKREREIERERGMAERECECSERNKMTRRRKGYKERMVLRGDEGVRNYLKRERERERWRREYKSVEKEIR